MADAETVAQLMANSQIATQYVDLDGNPSMDIQWNPNGSVCAIEGITSPDGRILGKMGHSGGRVQNLYSNVPGEKDQGSSLPALNISNKPSKSPSKLEGLFFPIDSFFGRRAETPGRGDAFPLFCFQYIWIRSGTNPRTKKGGGRKSQKRLRHGRGRFDIPFFRI